MNLYRGALLAHRNMPQLRLPPLPRLTNPPKPTSSLYFFTKNNRPPRTQTFGQPPPKLTTLGPTPQPRQIFILWSLHRLLLLPPNPTHLLPPPRPQTLIPHRLQHHHPQQPRPFPINNPTLTQHIGNMPTSFPPHQSIRSPLQQDHPTSRHPLGAHPGAHAPKHHHVQPHRSAHNSIRAAPPRRPTSAAAPLCHHHVPLLFYLNHPIHHLHNSHQRTTHRR